MSREKKRVVGKVGFCSNRVLGIKDRNGNDEGGHYVYIRSCKNGKCDVNVITSLETSTGTFNFNKLHKVRQGYLYPIPKGDGNFKQWSAINLDGNIKGISLHSIQSVGQRYFRSRHRFFVGKFTKKK